MTPRVISDGLLTCFGLQSFPNAVLNSESLAGVATKLTTSLHALSGQTYPSLCHIPSLNATDVDCFTSLTSGSLTLSFTPGSRDDWVGALKRSTSFTVDGATYAVQNPKRGESIGEMKSSKWVAHALGALVMRFWELIKKADSLDILVVLLGYVLMHVTFLRLWFKSRALGSNFWLSTGILSSSITAFLFTLPLCRAMKIPLDPVCMSEALPFLVCTVGFDKPLRLAREVLAHPHALKPQSDGRMRPAGDVILEALDRKGNLILRDYALEIAVLFIGANSKVGGLREFCALACLAMVIDCIMLATFYTAVLTIMLEVREQDPFIPTLSFHLYSPDSPASVISGTRGVKSSWGRGNLSPNAASARPDCAPAPLAAFAGLSIVSLSLPSRLSCTHSHVFCLALWLVGPPH